MSYSISIEYPKCDHCGVARPSSYYWDPTYNLMNMFAEAGMEPCSLDGMPTELAAERVAVSLARMESQPDVFRKLNPSNGWGSFDDVLPHINEFKRQLLQHPGAFVRAR